MNIGLTEGFPPPQTFGGGSTTPLVNPLKRSGVKWLHFEVFSAIQV